MKRTLKLKETGQEQVFEHDIDVRRALETGLYEDDGVILDDLKMTQDPANLDPLAENRKFVTPEDKDRETAVRSTVEVNDNLEPDGGDVQKDKKPSVNDTAREQAEKTAAETNAANRSTAGVVPGSTTRVAGATTASQASAPGTTPPSGSRQVSPSESVTGSTTKK